MSAAVFWWRTATLYGVLFCEKINCLSSCGDSRPPRVIMKAPTAITHPLSILVVEDDPIIRALLTDALADTGALVSAVATAEQGLDAMIEKPWSLLLTDVETPGSIDGLELAWLTSEKRPDTSIIVMSGRYDLMGRELPGGAQFLLKPWLLQDLMAAVGDHLPKPVAVRISGM